MMYEPKDTEGEKSNAAIVQLSPLYNFHCNEYGIIHTEHKSKFFS